MSLPIAKKEKHAGSVICLLEDIFERILDDLLNEKDELVLYLKSRKTSGKGILDAESRAVGDSMEIEDRAIRFPGRSVRETWKFAALLRILALSHSSLVNGTVITKRDIFYQDPDLFLRQGIVDRYVDDIAYTFKIRREELNIVAAAKGLVAGHMSIIQKDGKIIDCRADNEGILMPSMTTVDRVDIIGVGWVLVVEKEATFRTLVHSKFWEKCLAGKGILMTGKGYPDNVSKAWARYLSLRQYPGGSSPMIFGLMDFDPDGLAILSTYKHGSISAAWQNAYLVSPEMKWLGIKSEIIQSLHQKKDEGWIRLTARDRKMATGLLEKVVFQEEIEPSWRRQLQIMLMLNIKTEIQVLGDCSNLESFLEKELSLHGVCFASTDDQIDCVTWEKPENVL